MHWSMQLDILYKKVLTYVCYVTYVEKWLFKQIFQLLSLSQTSCYTIREIFVWLDRLLWMLWLDYV